MASRIEALSHLTIGSCLTDLRGGLEWHGSTTQGFGFILYASPFALEERVDTLHFIAQPFKVKTYILGYASLHPSV